MNTEGAGGSVQAQDLGKIKLTSVLNLSSGSAEPVASGGSTSESAGSTLRASSLGGGLLLDQLASG